MNDQQFDELKQFAELRQHWPDAGIGNQTDHLLIAAYLEIKSWRDATAWLIEKGLVAYMDPNHDGWSIDEGKWVGGEDDTIWENIVENAPTLLGAIEKAKEVFSGRAKPEYQKQRRG